MQKKQILTQILEKMANPTKEVRIIKAAFDHQYGPFDIDVASMCNIIDWCEEDDIDYWYELNNHHPGKSIDGSNTTILAGVMIWFASDHEMAMFILKSIRK